MVLTVRLHKNYDVNSVTVKGKKRHQLPSSASSERGKSDFSGALPIVVKFNYVHVSMILFVSALRKLENLLS